MEIGHGLQSKVQISDAFPQSIGKISGIVSSFSLAAVLHGQLGVSRYFLWLGPAGLGNITGGVLLVTLLEYGQVDLE